MTNHFSKLITQVKEAPKDQQLDMLTSGVIHVLQQSGNAETIQYGQELQQVKGQLVSTLQQS